VSAGVIASHEVGFVGSPYAQAVMADSPLLYCKADDLSGASAADASGNSRPLTIGSGITLGATALLSGSTNAFDLPGTGTAFMEAAYAAWMPLNSGAFSIELWFNADSLTSIRGLAGRDGSSRGWQWYTNASKLTLDVPFVSPTSGSATGATTLSTGTNYHAVLTYDGTTAVQYLQGVQDASCVTTMLDPGNRLTVGGVAAGAPFSVSFLFDGRFDEIAYYGTALSSTRVAAHYAAR
jgi:hypothetical protein